ncbi:methyltransferase family protein [Streptomyces sp. NPDC014344]|uniref:isoprenylcysteine carboxylmethyltransferase family protein n=1 Tax=Streptomyces sp. NPDC014344 TaxID=3364871 RepID=UPI0036F52F43
MNTRVLLLAAPRVLFLVGLVLPLAGIVRFAGRDAVAVALFVTYLAWLVFETRVTFRHDRGVPAESSTLLPYALARLAVLGGAAFGPMPWLGGSGLLAVPVVVFALGVVGRQAAITTLGRFYSHHVVRRDGHSVVSHGLYRFVRHPAYTGMLLANLGFTAYFLNPFSVVALVLLFGAVVRRILVEERVLWTVPEYPAYATGRARLLPRVW